MLASTIRRRASPPPRPFPSIRATPDVFTPLERSAPTRRFYPAVKRAWRGEEEQSGSQALCWH